MQLQCSNTDAPSEVMTCLLSAGADVRGGLSLQSWHGVGTCETVNLQHALSSLASLCEALSACYSQYKSAVLKILLSVRLPGSSDTLSVEKYICIQAHCDMAPTASWQQDPTASLRLRFRLLNTTVSNTQHQFMLCCLQTRNHLLSSMYILRPAAQLQTLERRRR